MHFSLSNLNLDSRRNDRYLFFSLSLWFKFYDDRIVVKYVCVYIFSWNHFIVNKYESENRAEAEGISR